MNFFKKLLGQNGNTNLAPQTQEFDEEWFAAVGRFGIVVGFKDIKLEWKHPDTGETMLPHLALAGSFEDWKQIKSAWDKRRLCFELLFETVARSMNVWQIANGFIAIRQPNRALEVLQQRPEPDPSAKDYAEHCEAFARAFQYLQDAQGSLDWAKKANDAKPESSKARLRFADALFMTGACDEANEIYSFYMKSGKSTQNASIATMFHELFALETGVVPSPVLAIVIGEKLGNPQQAAEFWKLAELEFYDSPHFRMYHAIHLIQQGEVQRAFAKLFALVQEMPWLRLASLNLESVFKNLDPDGTNLMPEFQAELRQHIKENGWTGEGMPQINIELGNK